MPTLRRHPGHRATPTPREGEGKDDSLESKPSEISIASLPRQEGLTEEQVLAARAVFAAADVDGSGTLERGELLSMFAELGLVLSTELMEEYVSSAAAVADSDADGRITFKEFLAMYAGLLLPQQLYGQEMRVAAGRGDARRVEEFMRRGCDARYADGKGWTAIHYAAEYDHPAIIKLIQDLSVQLTEERRQILQDAARRSQAAEAAAAAAAEAASASGSKRSTAGKTVLRSARSKASAAEEEEAEAAVPGPPPAGPGDLVDIDAPDKQGWTPLATACSAGHLRVVRLLLSLGADAGSVCCSGLTPLHSAASGGHVAIMTALLEAGAEVAARDMSGFTPLHLAAMGDAGDACTLLLSRGAPVTGHDALDVLGHPPSSYAHGAPSDPTSTAGILAAAEAKADAAGASQAAAAAASGGADHK